MKSNPEQLLLLNKTKPERTVRQPKSTVAGLGLCLAIWLLSGCGTAPAVSMVNETPSAKQQRLLKEAFALQDRMTKSLFSVSDQSSAEAAVKELDQLGSQLLKLAEEIKKTGEITAETRNMLATEGARRQAEAQKQSQEFISRLMGNPKLLQSLQPIMNKMNQLSKEFGGFQK